MEAYSKIYSNLKSEFRLYIPKVDFKQLACAENFALRVTIDLHIRYSLAPNRRGMIRRGFYFC